MVTELELKKLEDRIDKAKSLTSNIHNMKSVADMLKNGEDKQTIAIACLGFGVFIPREYFLELLNKSIKDCTDQLEKL